MEVGDGPTGALCSLVKVVKTEHPMDHNGCGYY